MTERQKRDDFDPSYWGAITWSVLFIFALSYPFKRPRSAQRKGFQEFLSSLQEVIPCHKCRSNFHQFLIDHPLEQPLRHGKIELLKWLVSLYNSKKPEGRRLTNIDALAELIKADQTVKELIGRIKKKYPKLVFD